MLFIYLLIYIFVYLFTYLFRFSFFSYSLPTATEVFLHFLHLPLYFKSFYAIHIFQSI